DKDDSIAELEKKVATVQGDNQTLRDTVEYDGLLKVLKSEREYANKRARELTDKVQHLETILETVRRGNSELASDSLHRRSSDGEHERKETAWLYDSQNKTRNSLEMEGRGVLESPKLIEEPRGNMGFPIDGASPPSARVHSTKFPVTYETASTVPTPLSTPKSPMGLADELNSTLSEPNSSAIASSGPEPQPNTASLSPVYHGSPRPYNLSASSPGAKWEKSKSDCDSDFSNDQLPSSALTVFDAGGLGNSTVELSPSPDAITITDPEKPQVEDTTVGNLEAHSPRSTGGGDPPMMPTSSHDEYGSHNSSAKFLKDDGNREKQPGKSRLRLKMSLMKHDQKCDKRRQQPGGPLTMSHMNDDTASSHIASESEDSGAAARRRSCETRNDGFESTAEDQDLTDGVAKKDITDHSAKPLRNISQAHSVPQEDSAIELASDASITPKLGGQTLAWENALANPFDSKPLSPVQGLHASSREDVTNAKLETRIREDYRRRFSTRSADIHQRLAFWYGTTGSPPFSRYVINLGSNWKLRCLLDDPTWELLNKVSEDILDSIPASGDTESARKEKKLIQRLSHKFSISIGKQYFSNGTREINTSRICPDYDQYDRWNVLAHDLYKESETMKDEKHFMDFLFYQSLTVMERVDKAKFDQRVGVDLLDRLHVQSEELNIKPTPEQNLTQYDDRQDKGPQKTFRWQSYLTPTSMSKGGSGRSSTLPDKRSQEQEEQESQKSTPIIPQKRKRDNDVTNSLDKRLDQTVNYLKRLLPGNWLNDELINTILRLFAWGPQVRVLSTFFLHEGWKPNSRLLSVRAPVEQLVVPVCRHGHWTLLFVHIGSRIIEHYDSLSANRSTAGHQDCYTCQLMARTIDDALETAGTWTFQDERNHARSLSPQQINMIDCGVFLLYNAYCLSHRLDPWQDTVIPHDWRLRWARELVQQGLSHATEEDVRKAETLSSMEKVERQSNRLSVNANVSQSEIDAGTSSPVESEPKPISNAAPLPMERSSNVPFTPLHDVYEESCLNANLTFPALAVLRSTTSSLSSINSPLARKNTRRSSPKISHPISLPKVSSLALGESGSEINTYAIGMTIADKRIHREPALKDVEQMETSSPLQSTSTYVPSPLPLSSPEDLISPREVLMGSAGIDPDQEYYGITKFPHFIDILGSQISVTNINAEWALQGPLVPCSPLGGISPASNITAATIRSETPAPATSPITSEQPHNLTATEGSVPGIPDTLQTPLVRPSSTRTTGTILPLEIRNENSQTSTPFTTDRTKTVEAPDISQLPPSYLSSSPDSQQQAFNLSINASVYDLDLLSIDWSTLLNQDSDLYS
ncbi:MAG: hypothetical protein Q9175_007728, partial [Cornicularia normoerica]